MKKLVMSMMFAGGILFTVPNAQAQVEKEAQVPQQEQQMQQDGYTSIEVANLPQAVKDSVTEKFQTQPQKAWVKDAEGTKTYKLALNVNGEKQEVYADEEGNWVEEQGIQ